MIRFLLLSMEIDDDRMIRDGFKPGKKGLLVTDVLNQCFPTGGSRPPRGS